jgi:protein gp37
MTKIEWTEATWNPIVGCSIVSPGCTNCYAMRMAARLDAPDAASGRRSARAEGARAGAAGFGPSGPGGESGAANKNEGT